MRKPKKQDRETAVYGAGLAGMVAAINLAREGHSVTVYDREAHIGGSALVHPSIHTTPLQPEETWRYIGVDLSDCFVPTGEYPAFWYNAGRITLPAYVKNLKAYNVERGPRKTSIDTRLYEIARKEKVRFVFGGNLGPEELRTAPKGSIIATGLYREVYELVGVRCAATHGYIAAAPATPGESSGAIHMGRYSVDYGYTASLNGLMFALLFSRTPLAENDLDRFRSVLRKSRGLEFEDWHPFTGYFPRETKLFWEGKILAGTLSGMIEPFWGYGIVGALLSGKVAALAHSSKTRAAMDFHRFTGSFARKLARKEKMDSLPFNKQLLRLGILKARFDCWRNPALAKAARDPVRWFT
jgi:hypothetical protein